MAKMNRSEAGKRGGQATAKRHGATFFAEIGRKGGTAVSKNRDHMSKIGRIGGKSRKAS